MRKEYEAPQISQIVGQYFIKLTKLSNLIHQAYAGSNATEINFFIDVYSIKNSLLGKNFVYTHEYELCSLILDMVVFYKNYFRNIGVHCKFHIVNSNNIPKRSREIYPQYNADYVIKMTSSNMKWIEDNLVLLKSLVDYFDDIYYHDTKFEAAAVMQHTSFLDNNPMIILSKDPMCGLAIWSYPTCRATWLRPKKYRGHDNSFICNYSNILDCLILDCGLASGNYEKLNIRYLETFDIFNFFAMTKFPARCMPQIMPYRKFAQLYNMDLVDMQSDDKNVVSRRKALDLDFQGNLYMNSPEFAESLNQPPKKHDIEGLKHINNYYFTGNPLMLDDLLR